MEIKEFLEHFLEVTESASAPNQYTALCPAHADSHPSLSIGLGEDEKILIHCHAGCDNDEILQAVGLKQTDLFLVKPRLIARYNYTDEHGEVLYAKLRYSPKGFCIVHDVNGVDKLGMNKHPNVLYHLPDLIQAIHDGQPVFIVEGEKDVETLRSHGLTATCNSFGAGGKSKWPKGCNDYFKGANVYIIQDNDEPGKKFAKAIADELSDIAASLKIIDLSLGWVDLPEKGDISDVLHSKEDVEKLMRLVEETALYAPRSNSTLKIKRLSEVEPKEAKYLFQPYIPLGTLTLLVGEPGSSKTWFALYLAAIISNGACFLTDEEAGITREPKMVIYQSRENDYETVVRPRLDQLNANTENIIFIDETDQVPLSLGDNRLEEAIKTFNPALVIIDPLQSYLGSKVDMHRANEVRPVLDKVLGLSSKYECTFLVIMHLSKMDSARPVDRILGSIDFAAAARSVCVIGHNPNNAEQRVLAHAKFNNGVFGKSIAYRITETSGIELAGFCAFVADDIVGIKKDRNKKQSPAANVAEKFLMDELKNKECERSDILEEKARNLNISKRTLQRTKKKMGIEDKREGFPPKTLWSFPKGRRKSKH